MKRFLTAATLLLFATTAHAALVQPDPGGRDGFQINTSTGAIVIMRAGTLVMTISSSGDLTVDDDLIVTDDAAIGGLMTVGETLEVTGDITALGAAGALTFGSAASSVVYTDASATGLLFGSAGHLNLLTLISTDNQERLVVTGETAVMAFQVAVGLSTFVELATFTAGADMNGDILAGGGAGALTFDAASASVVYTDASATGLIFGSAGHTNLLTLISTNDQERLVVTGETAVMAFQVAVGLSTFVELATFTAGADMNDDILAGGGAGALTFDAASASVVYTDGSATGLLFGSAGHLNLLTLVSTDNQERLVVTGETAVLAFHVAVGLSTFVELATFTAGADMNGDILAGGGASALTFDAASSSVEYTDASATGLIFGSTGHLNLLTLVSTDNQERLVVTGETAVLAFHVAVGLSTFAEIATFTAGADMNGDILAGGGAGALTFDAASASILTTDNSTTGLDIGAAGKTAMIRLITTDDAEYAHFISPAVFTGIYETFGEGAAKGLSTLQLDGTAEDGTADVHNVIRTGNGNRFGYVPIVAQTDIITMTATGMDIGLDQVAADGAEIYTGYVGASGRPMIVGTDSSFYFLVGVDIDDVSGTDEFHCGLRTAEVMNPTFNNYDTYVTLGTSQSAVDMVLEIEEELNAGAGATTNTNDTLADGINYQMKFLADATGNITFLHDATTPGTLAAPSAISAFQFDDGDMVIPFCHYLQHADFTEELNVTHWEFGLQ